jgi:hypothetical protein
MHSRQHIALPRAAWAAQSPVVATAAADFTPAAWRCNRSARRLQRLPRSPAVRVAAVVQWHSGEGWQPAAGPANTARTGAPRWGTLPRALLMRHAHLGACTGSDALLTLMRAPNTPPHHPIAGGLPAVLTQTGLPAGVIPIPDDPAPAPAPALARAPAPAGFGAAAAYAPVAAAAPAGFGAAAPAAAGLGGFGAAADPMAGFAATAPAAAALPAFGAAAPQPGFAAPAAQPGFAMPAAQPGFGAAAGGWGAAQPGLGAQPGFGAAAAQPGFPTAGAGDGHALATNAQN